MCCKGLGKPAVRLRAPRARIPERSHVELVIHDVVGREVHRVAMPALGAGTHPYTWTSPPRSGVYWIRLRGRGMDSGRSIEVSRKVTVVR